MSDFKTNSNDWAAKVKKNTVQLGLWTLAWLVTMAAAAFGPDFIWSENKAVTILAILINLAVGFGMILANIRSLKGQDEMHRKIQLEAMGLALGVAIVVGLAYSMLDTSNLIAFDAEISHLVILIGLTYAAGIFAGLRKYL